VLSLSWVSKLCICLASVVASSEAFSEWISAEGRYFLSRDITQRECDANALMEARRAAMSKAGLETLASTTRDMCVEAGAETNCEMHQQTMNYFDGGFIAGTRNLQRRKETTTSGEVCVASIEANVKKYSSRADPNFLLQAEFTGRSRKRHGEEFLVKGEATKGAHLYLFGYYPKTHGEKYFRILPNQHEGSQISVGFFQIPGVNEQYKLWAKFPENTKSREVMEYLIVVASKKKLDMLSEQSSEDFHRRLHEVGRENWQKTELGYSILRDE
jgi:hypothetical protein